MHNEEVRQLRVHNVNGGKGRERERERCAHIDGGELVRVCTDAYTQAGRQAGRQASKHIYLRDCRIVLPFVFTRAHPNFYIRHLDGPVDIFLYEMASPSVRPKPH